MAEFSTTIARATRMHPPHVRIVHRRLSPIGRAVDRSLLRQIIPVAYDIDDSIYLEGIGGGASRVFRLDLSPADLAHRSGVVIAGSSVLADWASAFNERVVVIPSCIEPGAYTRKNPLDWDLAALRLVWIGSETTESELDAIAPALRAIASEMPISLTVVGSQSGPAERIGIAVERVPWSVATSAHLSQYGDVGVMPLRDSPFNRGKCAYKLLQYGAAGMPVIGSPVGASAEFLKRCGAFSAETNDDWIEALRSFARLDMAERFDAGRRTLAEVKHGYSYSAHESLWKATVQSGI